MNGAVIVQRIARVHPIIRTATVIVAVLGLGLALAFLLTSPFQKTTAATISTLFFLTLIVVSPLHGFLLWLISHPLTGSLINIELGYGIPDLSLARICVGFLIILVLAQVAIRRRQVYGVTKVEITFVLFILGFGASMIEVLSINTLLQSLFDTWIMPLIAYFLIKNFVTNQQKLNLTLKSLLIIGVYSAIYMLYELQTGNILFRPERLGRQFYGDSSVRIVRGLYGTTLTFGLLFNWLLPIAIYYFFKAPASGRKILYGLIIGLLLVGILVTYKRTMWIALLVSFFIMQWFNPQLRKFIVVLLLLLAIVIALNWSSISQSDVFTERAANEEEWSTANGRTDRWAEGWELWLEKPWFGHGFRKFNELAEQKHTENDYLHILVSSGLVGFLPYMAFYIFVLLESIRIYQQTRSNPNLFVERKLVIIFWGLYSTYFIAAMSGSGNDGHSIANFVFLTIIGAIVGSQARWLVPSKPRENRLLKAAKINMEKKTN
jgi:O-antigen ligase